MQYLSQSFRIKDQQIKDLFLDIAAEELGHMEMVAQTINLLNGHDVDADQLSSAGEIQSHVILGLNPGLNQCLRLFLDRRLCHRDRRSVCGPAQQHRF